MSLSLLVTVAVALFVRFPLRQMLDVTDSPVTTIAILQRVAAHVEAGTEVRWVNNGRNDHNVLPVDESLDWGVERDAFVPTDEYSHLFDQPGVYPYYCSIHGTKEVGMVGAIVVTEPA